MPLENKNKNFKMKKTVKLSLIEELKSFLIAEEKKALKIQCKKERGKKICDRIRIDHTITLEYLNKAISTAIHNYFMGDLRDRKINRKIIDLLHEHLGFSPFEGYVCDNPDNGFNLDGSNLTCSLKRWALSLFSFLTFFEFQRKKS